MREQDYSLELINRLNYIQRIIQTGTLILGGAPGPGGGGGSPPGGFSGMLPQTRVAGDTTESHIPSSGSSASLYNNLLNIRAWEEPSRNFFVSATIPESNLLNVSSGSWHYASGSMPLVIGSQVTPVFSPPSSGSRIDLLVIDTHGNLSWTQGTEGWSPVPPPPPLDTSGYMPLWYVEFSSSGSAIHNTNRGENYLWLDARPFLNWGMGGGGQTVFGSTAPVDVGATAIVGTSGSASRSDHAHRGVHSISTPGGSFAFGDIVLTSGSNISISQSSGSLSISSTASSGSSYVPVVTGLPFQATMPGKYEWYIDGPLSIHDEVGGVKFTSGSFTSGSASLYLGTSGSSDTITDIEYSTNGTAWSSLFTNKPILTSGQKTSLTTSDKLIVPPDSWIRLNVTSSGSGAISLSASLTGMIHYTDETRGDILFDSNYDVIVALYP